MARRRAKAQDNAGEALGGDEDMIFSPVCTWCKYWSPADGHHCDAYPAGGPQIPQSVWSGANYHLRPIANPSDHGIVFDLAPEASPAAFKAENPGLAAAYAKREGTGGS